MENVQGTNVDALDNKDEGKLLIHTYMPEGDTFPPSVRALWLNGGHANSSLFEAERNGFVRPLHASFGKLPYAMMFSRELVANTRGRALQKDKIHEVQVQQEHTSRTYNRRPRPAGPRSRRPFREYASRNHNRRGVCFRVLGL